MVEKARKVAGKEVAGKEKSVKTALFPSPHPSQPVAASSRKRRSRSPDQKAAGNTYISPDQKASATKAKTARKAQVDDSEEAEKRRYKDKCGSNVDQRKQKKEDEQRKQLLKLESDAIML